MSIADNSTISNAGSRIVLGRKSWVPYTLLSVLMIPILLITFIYGFILDDNTGTILFFISFLYYIYKFAVIRSYKISIDSEGIWFTSGILPWTYSGNGIRWNDADMAFYHVNFASWLTNSYAVSINHKYTNRSDFTVSNIWKGRNVCATVHRVQKAVLAS